MRSCIVTLDQYGRLSRLALENTNSYLSYIYGTDGFLQQIKTYGKALDAPDLWKYSELINHKFIDRINYIGYIEEIKTIDDINNIAYIAAINQINNIDTIGSLGNMNNIQTQVNVTASTNIFQNGYLGTANLAGWIAVNGAVYDGTKLFLSTYPSIKLPTNTAFIRQAMPPYTDTKTHVALYATTDSGAGVNDLTCTIYHTDGTSEDFAFSVVKPFNPHYFVGTANKRIRSIDFRNTSATDEAVWIAYVRGIYD